MVFIEKNMKEQGQEITEIIVHRNKNNIIFPAVIEQSKLTMS